MRKKTLLIGVVFMLAIVWCMNAYAADAECPAWNGFWNSLGGFLYNVLPWNWGSWMK